MKIAKALAGSLLALSLSSGAFASSNQCPTHHDRSRLTHFRDQLERAPTTEAARSMALSKLALADKAIDGAERVIPGEPGLVDARARLNAFESNVATAASPHAVAAQFDGLMLADGGGCSYDTVEVVVIVIGFILGIIPGIIFLFLFC
jgi:hypothetical protein